MICLYEGLEQDISKLREAIESTLPQEMVVVDRKATDLGPAITDQILKRIKAKYKLARGKPDMTKSISGIGPTTKLVAKHGGIFFFSNELTNSSKGQPFVGEKTIFDLFPKSDDSESSISVLPAGIGVGVTWNTFEDFRSDMHKNGITEGVDALEDKVYGSSRSGAVSELSELSVSEVLSRSKNMYPKSVSDTVSTGLESQFKLLKGKINYVVDSMGAIFYVSNSLVPNNPKLSVGALTTQLTNLLKGVPAVDIRKMVNKYEVMLRWKDISQMSKNFPDIDKLMAHPMPVVNKGAAGATPPPPTTP